MFVAIHVDHRKMRRLTARARCGWYRDEWQRRLRRFPNTTQYFLFARVLRGQPIGQLRHIHCRAAAHGENSFRFAFAKSRRACFHFIHLWIGFE